VRSQSNCTASPVVQHFQTGEVVRTQVFTVTASSKCYSFALPHPSEQVLPGVVWGSPSQLFTPAYWATQAWLQERNGQSPANRIGKTLIEEVAACILGGYGIKAEVGLAAFNRLKEKGLLWGRPVPQREILKALSEPLVIDGHTIRYRFSQQRSRYLSEAISGITAETPPLDDVEFRNWLVKFPGIGLKTASWVTRNWRDSDCVAIIDVHVLRAGQIIGLFRKQKPGTDYLEMEGLFLKFAKSLTVRPSVLDSIIWCQMRMWGKLVRCPTYRRREQT
jgi:N-glycosylase/DNA lyase